LSLNGKHNSKSMNAWFCIFCVWWGLGVGGSVL